MNRGTPFNIAKRPRIYEYTIYATFTEREKELFEERAAIREYDGEALIEDAEDGALRDIILMRMEAKKNGNSYDS
jgi:hypothetical protein